jgi:hypothetical protein
MMKKNKDFVIIIKEMHPGEHAPFDKTVCGY